MKARANWKWGSWGDRKRHGMTGTPEHNAWLGMLNRCHNPRHPRFTEWGGRGIFVCERWRRSFLAFHEDMGARPSSRHSVDRIDNDGPYSPDNCRWATAKQQSTNRPSWVRLIKFRGQGKTLTDWAKTIGIARESLRDRLKTGWSVERALTTPKLDRRQ